MYQGPSDECAAKTEFRQLSPFGKAAILNKHNELRRRVAKGEETNGINGAQPAASNMKKMVWNEELEAVAQRWADQCTFGHDKKRGKLDGTYVSVRHFVYIFDGDNEDIDDTDCICCLSQLTLSRREECWTEHIM